MEVIVSACNINNACSDIAVLIQGIVPDIPMIRKRPEDYGAIAVCQTFVGRRTDSTDFWTIVHDVELFTARANNCG